MHGELLFRRRPFRTEGTAGADGNGGAKRLENRLQRFRDAVPA
jgi:hypothetical protein